MADYPIPELEDKTPLEVANKPTINLLASKGSCGMAATLFKGLPTGSDTANLSVLGYDPHVYYTGRSSIEALGLGVPMKDEDTIFRLNLVTVSNEAGEFSPCLDLSQMTMLDHSAGKITNEEAFALLDSLKPILETQQRKLYAGVGYRHICVWNGIDYDYVMIPPHDILRQNIKAHLPKGKYAHEIMDLMKQAHEHLMKHPINQKRMAEGKYPANCIWLWGEAKKPKLDHFYTRYGVHAAVVTAVPLIEGLAVGLGMEIIKVDNATGDYYTNYAGKAKAAVDTVLDKTDMVFIHVEAPDECGHDGDLELKIKSIERIDEMVCYIKEKMDASGQDYKLLILPDHATPIALRTHTLDPIPFLIYDSRKEKQTENPPCYDEKTGKNSGIFYNKGYELMGDFLKR